MVKEFDLIERIRAAVSGARADVRLGIGDDAALCDLDSGRSLVVTTDTLNEGVHFSPGDAPFDLGHKSLAVSLSDLAAMGAEPAWALLNLSVPAVDDDWIRPFICGFSALLKAHDVQLVGGDTCRGPRSITWTLMGQVQGDRALTRSGAMPEDRIVVSGVPGRAGLALAHKRTGAELPASLSDALHRPDPRVALGQALLDVATAAIDLSDGLWADLGHLCRASGLGATIDADCLPVDEFLATLEPAKRIEHQLGGGDDYELCFTVGAAGERRLQALADRLGLPLTVIGRMTEQPGLRCRDTRGRVVAPPSTGFVHFKNEDDLP